MCLHKQQASYLPSIYFSHLALDADAKLLGERVVGVDLGRGRNYIYCAASTSRPLAIKLFDETILSLHNTITNTTYIILYHHLE